MKLIRSIGEVRFRDTDDDVVLGTHPFDFYTDRYGDVEPKALKLSESSPYHDDRVDCIREVNVSSSTEVHTVEVVINVDVRLRVQVPDVEDADPLDLALEFTAEMDHSFTDNTGMAFDVDSEVMEVGDIHVSGHDSDADDDDDEVCSS